MTAGGAPRDTGGRKFKRAECPACRDVVIVRADGNLRIHYATSPPWGQCSGSLLPAPGHVHRCDCGARWDEDA